MLTSFLVYYFMFFFYLFFIHIDLNFVLMFYAEIQFLTDIVHNSSSQKKKSDIRVCCTYISKIENNIRDERHNNRNNEILLS